MNEQLQQALAELITKSVQTAEKAGEFIVSELPEVVGQLLAWEITWNLIWFCFGILVFILSVYGNYRFFVWAKSEDGDTEALMFMVITLIPVVIGMVFCGANLDWLKILIAPKVWLIEYAANLVK